MTGNQARLPGRVDVLVVGGGMAGMSAAMVAAEGGARTLVIEKGSRPGGSAALSVGMFWTIPDFETLRQRVPLGDPELGRAVVEEYPVAVETIRQMGVSVGDRVSGVMTVGLGHFIDVQELLDYELAVIESTGGRITCNASVRRLLADEEGAIVGAQSAIRMGKGPPFSLMRRSSPRAVSKAIRIRQHIYRPKLGPHAGALEQGQRRRRSAARACRRRGHEPGNEQLLRPFRSEPADELHRGAVRAAGPVPLQPLHPGEPARPPVLRRVARRRSLRPRNCSRSPKHAGCCFATSGFGPSTW